MSCGIGRRCGSPLLWLGCRPAAMALIRSLAWEPPYAKSAALKRPKKEKRKKEKKKERKKENSLWNQENRIDCQTTSDFFRRCCVPLFRPVKHLALRSTSPCGAPCSVEHLALRSTSPYGAPRLVEPSLRWCSLLWGGSVVGWKAHWLQIQKLGLEFQLPNHPVVLS